MLNIGRNHPLAPFRDEILSEAKAVRRGRKASAVDRPRIAHLRGVMAMERGQIHLAHAYLRRSIQLDATSPSAYNDLGDVLGRLGRSIEAIGAHVRALMLAPDDPVRYARLADALHFQQPNGQAVILSNIALRLRPDDPDLLARMGKALRACGRSKEAIACFESAVRLDPTHVDAFHSLGRVHLERGDRDAAIVAFERGLAAQFENTGLHISLGEALLKRGAISDARRQFQTAAALSPNSVPASRHYVLVTEHLGLTKDAVGGWIHLGAALESQRRFGESKAAYEMALARQNDNIRALRGLARTHVALGEPREAARRLEMALAVDKDHAVVHVELGRALHQLGDFERGWDELAWHHHPTAPLWRHVEQPLWDGSPLNGRTVLLWADGEQSDDDTIFFLRYIQFARASGGHVDVECDRGLVPLVRSSPGVRHVIATGGPLPPFDVHAPLRYLPSLVTTARSASVDIPYLVMDDQYIRNRHCRRCRPHGAEKPTIGISWAVTLRSGEVGTYQNPLSRVSLSAFERLAAFPQIRIVSLQLGPHADEMLCTPHGLHIDASLNRESSLADAAVAIRNLDLVLTVDTRLANLAGALGKPVWTLLPFGPGWPWPHRDEQTPWYPTMRLFRQSSVGDWTGVVNAAIDALTTADLRPSSERDGLLHSAQS